MIELGPVDPLRSVCASHLLPAARAAAAAAGVTRLADITRLDRLGLPVWQAVRPMSRALSVHQGKGVSHEDAQLGALLEAVESHHAETFDAEGPTCRYDDLPTRERAPVVDDFADDRTRPPSGRHRWVAAGTVDGGTLHLPFDLVSLDLTRNVPSLVDRASNGVATGASRNEAIAVALQELIERDAVTEWQAQGVLACTASALELDSVPHAWLHVWSGRLRRAAVAMRIYHVPSVTGTPVFACELNDYGKSSVSYRTIQGRGCHAMPEIALFKALAEALQARATYIAGAREDLVGADYLPAPAGLVEVMFGLPLPSGIAGIEWSRIAPGPVGVDAIVAALGLSGYDRIAIVELARTDAFHVVRAFICGLGSLRRRRRSSAL